MWGLCLRMQPSAPNHGGNLYWLQVVNLLDYNKELVKSLGLSKTINK